MIPEPFPGHGPGDQEPGGSWSQPAGGNEPRDAGRFPEDEEGVPEQGLFVCLPAEELTLAGFAEDGRADTMAPGPLLAAVVHAVTGEDGTGLAALSDDQLTGVLSAARRMESRAAWSQMAALAEFAARRPARRDQGTRGTGAPDGAGISVFAAAELAGELNLTWQSVAEQMAYSRAVVDRLPRTFAALGAGQLHPVHVRIIEDETRVLSPADAAVADEKLAEAARSKTFGQLRYTAHRLVLKLDPDAARRRKESAKQEAHVRRFREDSGNAGLVAREMPCDEVLASWQHVEQRALDLRAAGVPGTLRELRVRAYLDLLQERDSRTVPGDPDPDQAARPKEPGTGGGLDGDGDPGGPQDSPGDPGGPQDGRGDPGGPQDGPGGPGRPDRPQDGPGGHGASSSVRPARLDTGPSIAALVNITVPLSALQGDPTAPGEAAGFGLLDARDSWDLVAAAARHPRTRWCLTALHPDGTAAAHGCAVGQHAWPPGQQAPEFVRALKLMLNTVIRGPCDHARAQRGYRPSRELRHLVSARNTRCTAPGCSRPAARCDLDHTNPWHHGGPTCPCNLAPLCRYHHRCKQAEGWWLEQPEPGVLKWRVPSGRTYVTTPTVYPV